MMIGVRVHRVPMASDAYKVCRASWSCEAGVAAHSFGRACEILLAAVRAGSAPTMAGHPGTGSFPETPVKSFTPA
jgi:hypothetical protein